MIMTCGGPAVGMFDGIGVGAIACVGAEDCVGCQDGIEDGNNDGAIGCCDGA